MQAIRSLKYSAIHEYLLLPDNRVPKSSENSYSRPVRILRTLLKSIGLLIGLLLLTGVIVLMMDRQQRSYLDMHELQGHEVDDYLIQHVNLVPMTADTILEDVSIRIESGRIQEMGKGLDPEGAIVIDGQGKFLSPGLMDMHVHVWDEQELGLYLANGVTTIRNLWGRPEHLRMKERLENDEIIGPLVRVIQE